MFISSLIVLVKLHVKSPCSDNDTLPTRVKRFCNGERLFKEQKSVDTVSITQPHAISLINQHSLIFLWHFPRSINDQSITKSKCEITKLVRSFVEFSIVTHLLNCSIPFVEFKRVSDF